MKTLDIELEEYVKLRPRSWAKLIKQLRRQLDEFVEIQLFGNGHEQLKLGYLPLLMNIDPQGITNSELSKRACITKQGMSKIVSDLEELEYITVEEDSKDARINVIKLTHKGKVFMVNSKKCMGNLMDEYRELLGKKNFEHLVDMLIQIRDYNEVKESERKLQTSKYK